MFNVYPVELRYKLLMHKGVLRGIPVNCNFGCASVADAKRSIDQLQQRTNGQYYDFEIIQKR